MVTTEMRAWFIAGVATGLALYLSFRLPTAVEQYQRYRRMWEVARDRIEALVDENDELVKQLVGDEDDDE